MRLWLFDFDGTLSPLVADRNAAELHPGCAGMLKDISQSDSEWVAIISSRGLDDILPRVPIDNVIIGGNSGVEWQLPGGCRVSLAANREVELFQRRKELLPLIEALANEPGVDIEDKKWSLAIHMKKNWPGGHGQTVTSITAWAVRENIDLFQGPDVLEIQFLPGFNKSVGASFLAGLLKIDHEKDTIIYSGDDENDAIAMRWAVQNGGMAIMVGTRLDVPGAMYVPDQQGLIDMVRKLRQGD